MLKSFARHGPVNIRVFAFAGWKSTPSLFWFVQAASIYPWGLIIDFLSFQNIHRFILIDFKIQILPPKNDQSSLWIHLCQNHRCVFDTNIEWDKVLWLVRNSIMLVKDSRVGSSTSVLWPYYTAFSIKSSTSVPQITSCQGEGRKIRTDNWSNTRHPSLEVPSPWELPWSRLHLRESPPSSDSPPEKVKSPPSRGPLPQTV